MLMYSSTFHDEFAFPKPLQDTDSFLLSGKLTFAAEGTAEIPYCPSLFRLLFDIFLCAINEIN